MREPFHLRAPLPSDDQDREFVEPRRLRSFPAQIIEQVEHPLAQHRAAQQQIIGATDADARYLHNLVGERLLLLAELILRDLWKASRHGSSLRFFLDREDASRAA